ncbi:MAG: glycoside hydrolase family 3 N-terminal domain-containing protein [Hyphomicrobiales bacterium]
MAMIMWCWPPLIPKTRPPSRAVIKDVIRKQMGYDGLLMTDDLSMHALKGSFAERTRKSLDAGVDLVLNCHGILHEMEEVAEAAGRMKPRGLAWARVALKMRQKPRPFDEKMALRDLDEVLALS